MVLAVPVSSENRLYSNKKLSLELRKTSYAIKEKGKCPIKIILNYCTNVYF